ncbi:hypothetical protein ACFWFF_09730 [Streptomyces sp. NPDC060223]|uniref:hypothetical protein n=1 Tax=unclassified Streptomyces TaxID=2593676 RepID=UPI0036300A13
MASHMLYSEDISNQFGLVSIRDFETEDQPNAESGEEEVMALPGHLFVATRSDTEGDVRVEVHVGECDIPDVRVVFDGSMVFRSSFLCITGAVDPDEETFPLPRTGEWGIRVYVYDSPRPSRVFVFLDSGEWLASGGTLPD